MKFEEVDIPTGWDSTNIGEICNDLQYGYTASASEEKCGPRFLRITDIQDGKVMWNNVPYCEIGANSIEKYELCAGDIVFARTGGTVGKSFIIDNTPEKCVFASYLIRLSPHKEIFPKFLYYFFQSLSYWEQIGFKKGGLQGNVNAKMLSSIELNICPFNEQKRIVAKIEELFSELDKGIESLKTAREQLKIYRQAVLKHAFEGKLTANWREENKDKLETTDEFLERIQQEREAAYEQQLEEWKAAVKAWEHNGNEGKKPAKPSKPADITTYDEAELSKLVSLPYGWAWLQVKDLCDVVRGGSPRPAGDPKYYDGDIPFLKVADITRTTSPYLETYSYAIKKAGLQKTRKVSGNTLMLSNSGATLGVPKICLIEATFNDGIAAFLGLKKKHLLYHYYFWTSKTKNLRAINQGAAQPNLNTDLIKDVFIPVCSSDEMEEATKQIEEKLSTCDQISDEIENNLQKAEALRQSILKQAFSGKLVTQDPNDEPASVLLERIKADKEGNKKKRNAA